MRIVSFRAIWAGVLLLISVSVLGIVMHAITAQANISTLYASSCLGGWEHAHRAAGAPEAIQSDAAPIFNEANAAKLIANTHAQIFCGGFDGAIVDDTVPKKIVVRFSWSVVYPELPKQIEEHEEIVEEPIIEEDEESEESMNETEMEEGVIVEESIIIEATTTEDIVEDDPVVLLPETVEETDTSTTTDATSTPTTFLNRIARVAFAEEPEDVYGLVEVLYTLDGIVWKSLGFVAGDAFSETYFEIPITEASEWEDVSNTQIGVQSVPVFDTVAPIIYLDALWIEAEYEHVTTMFDMFAETLMSVTELPLDEVEEVGLENQSFVSEELPPVAPLPVRNVPIEIEVDTDATHSCTFDPFTITTGKRSSFVTYLAVHEFGEASEAEYQLEIGSLPEGIDITFAANSDYVYRPRSGETEIKLNITNVKGSRKGNFSISVIYTKETEDTPDSVTLCQMNIVNL